MWRLWWIVILSGTRGLGDGRKAWRYNNDVYNFENWEGGEYSQNCTGIIFPEWIDPPLSIGSIATSEIVLPDFVTLELYDEIAFDSNEDKCIRVKEVTYTSWLDPNAWFSGGMGDILHVEKIPCHYDIVHFPIDKPIAVEYPPMPVTVKKILLNHEKNIEMVLDDDGWQRFLTSDEGLAQFRMVPGEAAEIIVDPRGCRNKKGCVCHERHYGEIFRIVCDFVRSREKDENNCVTPIQPIGHCTSICGGIVLLEPGQNYEFSKMKLIAFTEYHSPEIKMHFSNIRKDKKMYSQVVFKDQGDYTELSAQKAKEFYEDIQADFKKYNITSATLEVSGEVYIRQSYVGLSISIVFGTLLTAIVFFSLTFFVFVGPYRIPIPNVRFTWLGNDYQPSRRTRPFMFARFDNKEGGRLSVADSVVSLDTAFDNPLFGKNVPSASTSTATIDTVIEKEHEGIAFENPMFEHVELKQSKKIDEVKEDSDDN